MSSSAAKISNERERKPKKKPGLKNFFFTNAFGIFMSRIFGFLRDGMLAAVFGASVYSDIFFIAYKFPNMFRRIVSEGAFAQSFLPFLISARNKGAFSVGIFWIFCFFILILSLFVMFCAPFITKILAIGYDNNLIELAAPLVRIHFWYLLLIFIVTYLSALLQYKNIFWVNAYNTLLLNLAMIMAMAPYVFDSFDNSYKMYEISIFLSYSVLVGGVCQIALHFYPMYASKIWLMQYVGFRRLWNLLIQHRLSKRASVDSKSLNLNGKTALNAPICATTKRFALRLAADIKAFFKAFLPAMIGASSLQIIAIIDSSMITLLPDSAGGVSIINYANRIFQLPLAIFAIALSTALFPTIARAIKDRNDELAFRYLTNSFWFLLIALCLCALGAIMLSSEIIWLLFERKNFSRADTLQTAQALSGYMIGLAPYGLSKILSLWLYSKKKQGAAAKISVIALGLGTLLLAIFIAYARYMGADSALWEYRYFIVALCGSVAGFVLFAFSVAEFGIKQFLVIINNKKFTFLLISLLLLEFVLLKIFKLFFFIS